MLKPIRFSTGSFYTQTEKKVSTWDLEVSMETHMIMTFLSPGHNLVAAFTVQKLIVIQITKPKPNSWTEKKKRLKWTEIKIDFDSLILSTGSCNLSHWGKASALQNLKVYLLIHWGLKTTTAKWINKIITVFYEFYGPLSLFCLKFTGGTEIWPVLKLPHLQPPTDLHLPKLVDVTRTGQISLQTFLH